jgi:sec-independent protein translocase protein TatA
MNFFDMGPLEILLILIIALIIFGPGKIPEIGRTLGRTVNAIRKASFDLTKQIKQELEVDEKDQPSPSSVTTDDKTKELPEAESAEAGDGEENSPRDQ